MRSTLMPGEDPMTLDPPYKVAAKILDLCLPSFQEAGKLYNYPTKQFVEFPARG
jgi:hypothetical protein